MRRDAFQAIADPTRREIIGMLSYEPLNINELSEKFNMTRAGVSKHIKILKECDVITVEKKGRERLCHARIDALAEVATWISQYRMFWNDSLDNLENLLKKEDTINPLSDEQIRRINNPNDFKN